MRLSLSKAPPEILDIIIGKTPLYNPNSAEQRTAKRWELNEVERLLTQIDPDHSYDRWCKVGMAIHAEGLDCSVWEKWSSRGSKFKPGECQQKWQSFRGNGGVTMGTLVHLANGPSTPQSGFIQKPEKQNEPKPLEIVHWSKLAELPRRSYLVKGMIEQGSMSVIYGPSNSGKTFVALDIACHIALGWEWYGQRVRQGKVVYIAGEGGLGIEERLTAFRKHYQLDDYADVYVIPQNVVFCDDTPAIANLIQCLDGIEDIKLIIVDTLARAMGGGDENSSKDMGSLIHHCDIVRHQLGSHIMLIHHSGKDAERGARGHSSLKAAIDTEIEVKQANGLISFLVTKQREGRTHQEKHFELVPYEVRVDEDGEKFDSCALISSEKHYDRIKLTPKAQRTYDVFCEYIVEHGERKQLKEGMDGKLCVSVADFKDYFFKAGIADSDKVDSIKKAFSRHKSTLKDKGLIGEWGGILWLQDELDIYGQTIKTESVG